MNWKKNMRTILKKLSTRPLYGASRMLQAYPHAVLDRNNMKVNELIEKLMEDND